MNTLNKMISKSISSVSLVLAAAVMLSMSPPVRAENVTLGTGAGLLLDTGDRNVLLGVSAGMIVSTGSSNTYVGNNSGANTNAQYNTAVGYSAGMGLFMNSTGNHNTFVGYAAGQMVSTADQNVFIGNLAGNLNSTGNYNVFVGTNAGVANESASYNTFIGGGAGAKTTTGEINTFVGKDSGLKNNDGYRNTFIGRLSGQDNVSGHHNIFIGDQAGYGMTGSYKLAIGNTGWRLPLLSGDFLTRQLTVNGTLIAASQLSVSDGRLKRDIRGIDSPLAKVLQLRGVSFTWKADEYPDKGFPAARQIGLMAQEVEKVLPEVVQTDDRGFKSVSYDKIVPVLIEAVKERQKKAEGRRAAIDEMRREIEEIRRIMAGAEDDEEGNRREMSGAVSYGKQAL